MKSRLITRVKYFMSSGLVYRDSNAKAKVMRDAERLNRGLSHPLKVHNLSVFRASIICAFFSFSLHCPSI